MALIIMLVLVVMGVLYLVVNGASLVGMRTERQRGTHDTLAQAKLALVGYAATYRDTHSDQVPGYLPCPDIDGDGSADALSGDCGGTDGRAVIGLLPYRQLGLPNNLDAEGNCLWYAVSGTFKNSGSPLPLMNWDVQGQIEIRDTAGNLVTQPDDNNGGAAAVIFSVGVPLSAQSRTTPTAASPCGISVAIRADAVHANYIDVDPAGADMTRSQPFPSATNATIRVAQGTPGGGANNDRILTITPREIFDLVAKRADFSNPLSGTPRGDVNVLTDRIRAALESQLWPNIVSNVAHPPGLQPSNQAGYVQAPGRYTGELPPGLAITGADYVSYLTNWTDQYRYTLCNSTTTPCLTVNSDTCYGAVLFSGRTICHSPPPPYLTPNGDACHGAVPLIDGGTGPRPSTQKPPPAPPATYTTLLTNYFENGLAMLDGSSSNFAGSTSYASGAPAADVAACLINKANIPNFDTDIGTLTPTSSNPGFPLVAINTTTQTVTLGNVSGSGPTALAGCVWFPNAVRFSTSLRVYFEFVIQDAGQGFTFTIADAAQNGNAIPGCGGSGHALGYSGVSVGSGIAFPKIGLEIDTASQTPRRDPSPHHAAFLSWGSTASNTDDNTHNAGAGTATEPLNPRSLSSPQSRPVNNAQWSAGTVTVTIPNPTSATSFRFESNQNVTISGASPSGYNGTFPITVIDTTHFTYPLATDPGSVSSTGTATANFQPGIATVGGTSHFNSSSVFPLAKTILVRLDISKQYAAPVGIYTMKAYIADADLLGSNAATGSYSPTCGASDLGNVFIDLDDICYQAPMIERNNILVADISGEALANVYLGFTNGQSSNSGAGNQSIVISNFIGRSQ